MGREHTENSPSRRWALPVSLMVAALLIAPLVVGVANAATASDEPHYLSAPRSLEVLRTAFAAVAERPIREGRIVVAPTSVAISALSDKVNVSNGAFNPRTGRTWAQGDSSSAWPYGIRGFTDVITGDVYINASQAIETTTPHEMLHSNSSPEFLETLGLSVYEGATEQLALDALAVSRINQPKTPEYAEERLLVAALVKLAGRDKLVAAYFNGGAALADLVQTIGSERATRVKNATAIDNLGEALRILEAPATASIAGAPARAAVPNTGTAVAQDWDLALESNG